VTSLLSVAGLTVEFERGATPLRAVAELDLELAPGEILAVVGESGSGKSVSALALFDLLPPGARVRSRRMQFAGRELSALAPRARRALCGREMALVFQDPQSALHPCLTVGRQLGEVLEQHERLSRAAARARAQAALESVGIAEPARRLDAFPHELSGGMRQRVLIAMALIAAPRLIVADEPTTALDVTLQAQVLELLRARVREQQAALILITHSPGVVASVAERVLVMYAGRAVEEGRVEDVLLRPRHPYTRALLECVPRLDRPVDAALRPIPGAGGDAGRERAGCAFAPRCALRIERCERERPELEGQAGGGRAACFRAGDLEALR